MSNPFGCCSCSGMLCPFFFLLSICFIHQEDPCKEEFGATQHPDNNLQLLNGLLAFLFFGIWSALIYKNHYFDIRDFQCDFVTCFITPRIPTHTSYVKSCEAIAWSPQKIGGSVSCPRALWHEDRRSQGVDHKHKCIHVHSLYCKKKNKKNDHPLNVINWSKRNLRSLKKS